MPLKKEQQQIVLLVVVLAIIAGVLLYFYRDSFLPRPTGETVIPTAPPRMTIPPSSGADLYDRADFKALKRFGDVPVRSLETAGSPEPFITDTKNLP